eukprot:TRINITY_DN3832_c0_g1_i1.p1 TRINITY_DN3832_c0_g1~~TRINITY_DN3832_c0_g1_i1.p1  ORF type:complete len:1449 (-),score=387.28 TRINITY_DN3832_c0_g1_i1:41-4387(-)
MMRRIVSWCGVLLAISGVLSSVCNAGMCNQCGPVLTQMLSGVQVNLGTVPVTVGFISVNLTNLMVSNMSIGEININSAPNMVMVNVTNAGATLGAGIDGGGSFTTTAKNITVDLALDFTDNAQGVVNSMALSYCKFNIVVQSVTFVNDTILTGVADLFAPLIGPLVSGLACDFLKPLVNTQGSALLSGTLDPLITPLLGQPAPLNPAPAPVSPRAYPWANLQTITNPISELLASNGTNNQLLVNNLANYLTNNTGMLTLQLNMTIPLGNLGIADVNLTLQNITIGGLNTFTTFKVIEPVNVVGYSGAYSYGFDIGIHNLTIQIGTQLSLGPGSLITRGNGIQVTSLTISTGITDLYTRLVTHVEFDAYDFLNVKTNGQLLNNTINCTLTDILKVNVTQLNVTFAALQFPVVSGFDGLGALFNEVVGVAQSLFGGILSDAVHGLAAGEGRVLINNLLNNTFAGAQANASTICPNWIKGSAFATVGARLVDDTKFLLFTVLNYIVKLFSPQSPIFMPTNVLIDRFLPGGQMSMQGNMLAIQTTAAGAIGLNNVMVAVGNLTVKNIDSFYALDMLNATAAQNLYNNVGFGGPASSNALTIGVDMLMDLQGSAILTNNGVIHDQVKLGFAIANSSTMVDLTVAMIEWILDDQSIYQSLVSSASRENLSVLDLAMTVQRTVLNLTCETCTSSAFPVWQALLQKPAAGDQLTSNVQSVMSFMGSPAGLKLINGILRSIFPVAPAGAATNSSNTVQDAGTQTVAAAATGPDSMVIIIAVLACLVFLVVAAVGFAVWWKKRNTATMKTSANAAPKQSQRKSLGFLLLEKATEDDNAFYLGQLYRNGLSHHSDIPRVVKLAIPLMLVGNIALFINAHVVIGSNLIVTGNVAGDSILTPGLFGLSLVQTVREMINGQLYFLAALIVLLGVVWPYVKSISMLYCWFQNPEKLTPRTRHRILHWLDILGKWAMIDIYVMIILMVAFKVRLATPNGIAYLPDNFVLANLFVMPGWGAFAFVIAIFLQLAANNIILQMDIRVQKLADTEQVELLKKQKKEIETGQEEADIPIPDVDYDYDARAEALRVIEKSDIEAEIEKLEVERELDVLVKLRKRGQVVAFLLLISSLLLLVIGAMLPTFNFQFLGLVGFVMGPSALARFSIIQVANGLLQPDAGFIFLALAFLLFAFIMPVLVLLVLTVLWVVPVKFELQMRLLKLLEWIRPVAAVDVFVVSVLAMLTQVKQLVGFFVGHNCDSINAMLATYANGLLNPPTCMDLTAAVEPTAFVLFLGTLLSAVISNVVADFCEDALRNGEWQSSEADEKFGTSRALRNWKVNVRYDGFRYNVLVALGFIKEIPREEIKENMNKRNTVALARKVLGSRASVAVIRKVTAETVANSTISSAAQSMSVTNKMKAKPAVPAKWSKPSTAFERADSTEMSSVTSFTQTQDNMGAAFLTKHNSS